MPYYHKHLNVHVDRFLVEVILSYKFSASVTAFDKLFKKKNLPRINCLLELNNFNISFRQISFCQNVY